MLSLRRVSAGLFEYFSIRAGLQCLSDFIFSKFLDM